MVTRAAVVVALVLLGQPREPVTRIVSTSPSTTEILFALGLGDRVVGVSDFCRYPPEVTSLPRIGNVLHPDLERIVTLRPDLVVLNERSTDFARRLSAAELPFVAVSITTLADVTSAIVRIGEAAGIDAHARAIAAGIDVRLRGIRSRTPAGPRPKVLLILGRAPNELTGIIAAGAGSYLNDLIEIAGGTNAVSSVSAPPYPKLSLESVLSLNPDVIVDTIDMGATETERGQQVIESRTLWERYRTLSAVRTGRVRAAETDAVFIPGPRVVDVAEWLAGVIHGPVRP